MTTFTGTTQSQNFNGGANSGSNDVIDYSRISTPIQATFSSTLYAGTVVKPGGNDTFTGIRGILGSGGNDVIIGTDNASTNATFALLLEGTLGNDTIDGRNNVQNQINYQTAPDAILVNLGTTTDANGNSVGTASDGYGTTDTLLNVARIRGTSFNDTINGGGADENFNGSLGNDTYNGGAGTDTLRYDSADFAGGIRSISVSISGGVGTVVKREVTSGQVSGTDTATNIERFRGTEANDTFVGSTDASSATVFRFRGGAGNDTINGQGLDINRIEYNNATQGVRVDLTAGTAQDGQNGTDTLVNVVAVQGSSFADTLLGSAGNDVFVGGDGNDAVDGRAGTDVFILTGNRSRYSVSEANGVITLTDTGGSDGTDTLSSIESFRFADQTLTLAQLLGTDGGGGDPTPPTTTPSTGTGGTGTSLTTTTDPSTAQTAADQAVQNLPTGTNTAAVEQAVDTFLSGLPTGTSVNVSTFTPTPGAAEIRIDGPTDGTQTLVFLDASAVPPGTPITLNNVSFVVLVGPASLVGGEGSQVVFGDDGAQSMVLGADDDTLHGGGGNDYVGSRDGNDMLFGDAGDDTVTGGVGNDTLFGGTDQDIIFGNQDADMLFGGQGQDSVFGGQDADQVFGNLGNDFLFGNMGADIIYGGQGSDTLFGGQGDDVLSGDLGDDVLSGDLGNDVLQGGAGANRYVFGQNSGLDLVLGFNQAQGDRIDLQGQSYTLVTRDDGSAQLNLSGGGQVILAGVVAGAVNSRSFA